MKAATVLVVEDDEDLRETIALALKSSGYVVREAANGRLALESIAERLPDAILLDMRMPVMSGWQFAEHFHHRHGYGTPLIVVSAGADVQQCSAQTQATDWLEKPFELDALIAKLQAHLAPERG